MAHQQVNLNGDSLETLVNQQTNVAEAAQALISALCEAMPHGRNYQTVEDSDRALRADRSEIERQIDIVDNILVKANNEAIRLTS